MAKRTTSTRRTKSKARKGRARGKPQPRQETPVEQTPVEQTPSQQAGLTEAQHVFALTYLANGFNATQAYLAAHPGVTHNTARTEGSRTLALPDVRAFLKPRLEELWRELQMDGEEALARVALDARADPRLLFDGDGNLLKPHEWPLEVVNSIESFELKGKDGIKVKLSNKLAARRLILEVTGKVKGLGDGVDALAAAIRADIEQHGEHRD